MDAKPGVPTLLAEGGCPLLCFSKHYQKGNQLLSLLGAAARKALAYIHGRPHRASRAALAR